MKSILLFFLSVCLLFSQISCKHSTSPLIEPSRYSLLSQTSIDAKVNCVLLDSSRAMRVNLAPGTYPLRTWGTTGVPACFVFSDGDIYTYGNTRGLQVRTISAGYDYPITIGQDSVFFAFYTKTADFVDMSSQMTFDLGVSRITVKALDNSISLDGIPATVVDIPSTGNYKISFSGSATVFEQNPRTEFFFQYGNNIMDFAATYSTSGSFSAHTKLYFFFVDTGSRSDNNGAITVNLYSQVN